LDELLTDEMRAAIGTCESFGPIEVARREIVKYAVATEQRLERFRSGDEAPPMFLFGLLRPVLPHDELDEDGLSADPLLPELPLSRVMAGGTKMRIYQPICAGDVLQATRTLVDMREKKGRSGQLIFVHYELRVTNEAGELVALETQTRILM
jgi:3-methylfumaryl-CoA hydratase